MARRTETPSGSEAAADRVRVPPPVPGGTGVEESLGRWLDDRLGDRRARAVAEKKLVGRFLADDDMPADPLPAEVPPPVPGGTEPITKGGKPRA